jgi:tetratricopeptide (TPR) repeat protein
VIDSDALTAVQVGLRALAHEEIEPAIVAFEAAVAERPNDGDRLAFLATALFAGRRGVEAEAVLDRALAIAPGGFWPNLKAGEIRFRLGDPVAAETLLLVALRAAPHGSREATEAAALLARSRTARTRSISHHAVLPRWLRGRSRAPNVEPGAGG